MKKSLPTLLLPVSVPPWPGTIAHRLTPFDSPQMTPDPAVVAGSSIREPAVLCAPDVIVSGPVIVSPALLTLVPIRLVIVVAKFGSSPRASARSFSVSSAAGELLTSAPLTDCTKAVVATWVELVPLAAVGAVGMPVSAGDDNGARAAKALARPMTSAI